MKNIILILLIVAIGGTVGSYYFYTKYQTLKSDPQVVEAKQNQILISKLGQLIDLPNEEPTIMTVADPSKLSDQPFFANAKTGDKVFIYSNAKKAILYDPVANKILQVAPLNLGQ